MAGLKYSLLLLVLISACSQATSNTKVSINNQLSNCIKIDRSEVIYRDGIPMLGLSYKQLKPTSECGCKSAISQYTSLLEMDGYNSQLLTAKVKFGTKASMIPLTTSKDIIGDYSVLVNLSCALPD
ncbi:DUF2195 family protein [Colwellia sp. UCD-KL20]|uniref:DUF2195 family protein n=1 Tax=Colwellia sp. UCD-KL20 TaxID=1917165 RepID=UPI00097081C2|nr:DUF2195 family protein [Colwellia sp. UCD-KL20]